MPDTMALKTLPACPVETTLMLIGDKWKVLILRDLLPGKKRFGELKKSLSGISQKVLTAQLRDMEEKGLVNDQPGQGKLDIFTTGSTEEYTMKAAKVGLDPVTSVQFYPPMKL